jgi:hypothetical protein
MNTHFSCNGIDSSRPEEWESSWYFKVKCAPDFEVGDTKQHQCESASKNIEDPVMGNNIAVTSLTSNITNVMHCAACNHDWSCGTFVYMYKCPSYTLMTVMKTTMNLTNGRVSIGLDILIDVISRLTLIATTSNMMKLFVNGEYVFVPLVSQKTRVY